MEKTVLLGFSQGGAMAIASGISLPLAGLIGCSAYPHPNWIPKRVSPPLLLTHGSKDEIVPLEASKRIIKAMKENKLDAQLIIFEGGHQIPLELIPSIQSSLQKWLI